MSIDVELVVSINGGKSHTIQDRVGLTRLLTFIDQCFDYEMGDSFKEISIECREIETIYVPNRNPIIARHILKFLGHLGYVFRVRSLVDKVFDDLGSKKALNVERWLGKVFTFSKSAFSSKVITSPKSTELNTMGEYTDAALAELGTTTLSQLLDKAIALGWGRDGITPDSMPQT